MWTSFLFAETQYRAVVRDPGAVRHQYFPVSAGAARKALPYAYVSMSMLTFSQLFPPSRNPRLRIRITLMQNPDPTFHFNVDPDPAPHQSDKNLRPLD